MRLGIRRAVGRGAAPPGKPVVAHQTDLEVQRRNVEELGGRIEIRSTAGTGTTFVLTVPLTMAIVQGVLVAAGGERWALRAGSSRQDIGLRRTGGGETLPDPGSTSPGKDLRLAWRLLETGTLELLWTDFTQPSTPRYDGLNPGFGQTVAENDEFADVANSRLVC